MASASNVLYEENLTCPICLDMFIEPICTPCGHNYCKVCITEYWAHSDLTQCPMCKESFLRRPVICVNTGLKDIVEQFKKMRVKGSNESPAKPGEVPCDVCPGVKLKAWKSCLVCLASYCHSHLEPHQRVTALKKHQLIDPVENLEDWVCEKHNKTFELFCRSDQMCVCVMCLKDDHATHETVPLEEEFGYRKAQLETMMSKIKNMEKAKNRNIWEKKYSNERSKKDAEKEIADVVEVLAALVDSVHKNQTKLIELIKEKQQVAEKQSEDFITELEQEITELQKTRTELEQLSHTGDPLRLLQSLPYLCVPAQTEDPLSLSGPPSTKGHLCVETMRKAVARLEETLSKETESLIREGKLYIASKADKKADTVNKQMTTISKEVESLPQDKLMMIQQCFAVDVSLDADTAFPKLTVSADGKQAGWALFQEVPNNPRRFEHQPYVLGKEGFSSGKFYYEVQLHHETGWILGVARESINRKKMFFFFTPEEGCWTVTGNYSRYEEFHFINTDPPLPLYLRQKPKKIGVFVDYEEAEVSFYDVDSRDLMYSFNGCTFTERAPTLKALYYSLTGSSISSRPKLYPIIGILNSDNPNGSLTITPVDHTN